MRRMIDNKKLKELEANGGTKWYKHYVDIKTAMSGMTVGIGFYSMFGESLKDGNLPSGNYPAIIVSAGGPSAPNEDTMFPILAVSSGRFTLKYLSTDGKIQIYNFNKSDINSDVVTKA